MRKSLLDRFAAMCTVQVRGRPRSTARYVERGLCRAKWGTWAGVLAIAVDGLIFASPGMRGRFYCGHPWGMAVAHAVAVAVLLWLNLWVRSALSIGQARRVVLAGSAAIVLTAAFVVGASHLDPIFMPMLSLSILAVCAVAPLRLWELGGLLAAAMAICVAVPLASGYGRPRELPEGARAVEREAERARAGAEGPMHMLSLMNPLSMGAVGMALGVWQLRDHKLRSKADALLRRRTRQIEEQKEEIERLLVGALPRPVADELRRSGRYAPFLDEACVVACDIVGFSKLCEVVPPQLIVEEIKRFYQTFDRCCERYHVEPLSSKGDSRLAISGLRWEGAAHDRRAAIDAVLAMLEFRRYLRGEAGGAGPARPGALWPARVGIHVGPVMMGVMDGARLCFDVWGETVNVAARLEQGAAANTVVVSESVLWACRGLFEHGPLRPLQVKATVIQGAAEVVGIREEYRDADGGPSERFWEVYRAEGMGLVPPAGAGADGGDRRLRAVVEDAPEDVPGLALKAERRAADRR